MSPVSATESGSDVRVLLTFHKVRYNNEYTTVWYENSSFACHVARVPAVRADRMLTQNAELCEKFAEQGEEKLVEWMESNSGYYVAVNGVFSDTLWSGGQIFPAAKLSTQTQVVRGRRSPTAAR